MSTSGRLWKSRLRQMIALLREEVVIVIKENLVRDGK